MRIGVFPSSEMSILLGFKSRCAGSGSSGGDYDGDGDGVNKVIMMQQQSFFCLP